MLVYGRIVSLNDGCVVIRPSGYSDAPRLQVVDVWWLEVIIGKLYCIES